MVWQRSTAKELFFFLLSIWQCEALALVTSTRPIAPWIGRLIFSPKNRMPNDSVSIVLERTPADKSQLEGKTAVLTWDKSSSYEDVVKRDVHFSAKTVESMEEGNIHPVRLDGLDHVGPLESLAGARAENDVRVVLKNPAVLAKDGKNDLVLEIAQDPIQVMGTSYMAAAIRRRISESELEVQHFDQESGLFDGRKEIVELSTSKKRSDGALVTSEYLEDRSGSEWYIYGDTNEQGIFVAEALESFRAVSLRNPDEVILNRKAALSYIDIENFRHTPAKGGTFHTALLAPSAESHEMALEEWKEGDRCLVIHLFGGIKGAKTDRVLGAVTGHFSFGVATVVRDSVTNDLRFDIDYAQVYAHNNNGIVSGHMKRSLYAGDFDCGWLGMRPISDIVIKLDCVTKDYEFGSTNLSPMNEFVRQLDIMMARYRVGDGTGAATVTPSRSCVQDSNQALYVALQRIEDQRNAQPEIDCWLEDHPDDSETLRYRRLQDLGRELEKRLTPMGIVRFDWKQNAEDMVGAQQSSNLLRIVLGALFSWRSCFPRRAHDELAKLVLKFGGSLWFIRTNQIGMTQPGGAPLAPTTPFGVKCTDNKVP